MASLSDTIESILLGSHNNSMITRLSYGRAASVPVTTKKYLEIPISGDVFELPVLAFAAFREMLKEQKECSALVAELYSCGTQSTYKTLDSIVKDVLSTKAFPHLNKIVIPDNPKVYYGTYGAIFDTDLKPLMMLSWIMERRTNAEGKTMYHYKKPLLRLHPDPCVQKEDPLQKMLIGRILSNTLEVSVQTPYYRDMAGFIDQSNNWNRPSFKVKVEIDECPLVLKEVDVPSISLTNEDLLQLAADHIDEILQ